jgi:hypothetical protein
MIRGLSLQDIDEMLLRSELSLQGDRRDLLEALVGDKQVDLEVVIATLSTSIAYGRGAGLHDVEIAGGQFSLDALVDVRRMLNHGLARDCDLPVEGRVEAGWEADPFRPHREFFRRLLRSRRSDLPRIRVFTTNYDLVIEKTLDEAGILYFDGFAGTVMRTFRPETFEHDLYTTFGQQERRMARMPNLLYLFKLHGSLNWYTRSSPLGTGTDIVMQRAGAELGDEDLSLIYPTPHKEADVLGYPYSELFRWLGLSLRQPETALLVIGYSFMDAHVNRLVYQSLGSNPTFQLFVISPSAASVKLARAVGQPGPGDAADSIQDEGPAPQSRSTGQQPDSVLQFDESPTGRLAQVGDARISVLAGVGARFTTFATHVMPDPEELVGVDDQEDRGQIARALGLSPELDNEARDAASE